MAEKEIRVAVWEYHDADGKRRRAWFGQTVDLTEDEIARGEAAGVFDQPEPVGDVPFTLPTILPIDPAADGADGGGLVDEPADDEVIATGDQADGGNAADQGDGDDQGGAQPAGEADAPAATPERPKDTALVAEWREYAEAQGMDADEAAKLSRAELRKRFA
jgi:hypothetical protein